MKEIKTRMCVVCRTRRQKGELSRFVIVDDEIRHDKEQKIMARGFYICKEEQCINSFLKPKNLTRKLGRYLTENEVKEVTSSLK